MNVLLTSVGRRSYLVRYFQAALRGQGIVVAANTKGNAPGMAVADCALIVPPSYDSEYGETIERICARFGIGLLCSCHDLDAFVLASQRERLRNMGVVAMLPDPEWARICLDKHECAKRLRAAGLPTAWGSISVDETAAALEDGRIRLPLLLKARFGFGSLALRQCHSLDALRMLHQWGVQDLKESAVDRFFPVPPEMSILMQELISGPEYCMDVVNDLQGKHAAHFVSEIHAMRGGESDDATTVSPGICGDLPFRFSRMTEHIGIWGVDLLRGTDGFKIIDVNPRFTGDYPFHHIAGVNVPAALIAWAEGRDPDPAWLQPRIGVHGFKDLVPTRSAPA